MVDYQMAVAAVQDPQADPILLAKIAYENPEFGANVAVHPRAYPGLKRWLAEFGDERARMTLAQMGVIATAGPVEDRFDESETPSGQRNPEPARAVKLAVEHDFVVVHDFAYAGLGGGGAAAQSARGRGPYAGRVAGAGVHGGDLLALEDVCDGGMACRIHRR